MFIGTRKKPARHPCFFDTTSQTTLHLLLLVLTTLNLLIVSGSPINGKNNKVDSLEKIIKHNSTSYPILPLLITNENKNESSIGNNDTNNNTFALIQGTKLERESTSSGWQINAGVYLEKSIGDGHSTMWESSSDDDDSSDDDLGGWGWAKGAGKSKSKKKFSMLSHGMEAPQLSSHVGSSSNGTSGNGSATIRLFSHDGVLGIDQLTLDSLADSELAMESAKFKLKNQHSWSEKGDTRDNKDFVGDDEDDDDDGRLRSDASYIWNKVYDLVKLYVLVLWIVFEG